MKILKNWTSIVESIIVTMIISIWVVWVFNIFSNSQKLWVDSKFRLQATLIAREWIEWFMNIRDTNWKIFQANLNNCWNALNYNANCITSTSYIIWTWSYSIYKNSSNRWYLSWSSITPNTYDNVNYRNAFLVQLDSDWLYTQSWGVSNLNPTFTREIKVSYLPSTLANQKLKVQSLVQWTDPSKSWIQKVQLETILTNWKKN
jgi:type II secretory pathway pseudopilin PulG